MKKIGKILAANRSEIAIRIFRAAEESGIKTAAIYSKEDRFAIHRFKTDESYLVGEGKGPIQAYLDIDSIIKIAKDAKVDAIHPGYGFLSESPELAEQCEKNDITFIGPSKEILKRFGNKTEAKKVAEEAKVGTVPSVLVTKENLKSVEKEVEKIGYPVIVKASWGGGGRGMKIVYSPEELDSAIELTQQESAVAFGDSTVYLEKFLENPRHIEVQVLADRHGNIIHLGDRDCSLQRRHQKVIEEAPAPGIKEEKRQEIYQQCIEACRQLDYVSAGTFEFLYENDNFYFIEMNTRIQVEHPVTESVTGIDLVKLQLRIARDEELKIKQEDIILKGHAIECRINAENSETFLPSPGKILEYHAPGGIGVRMDSHLYKDYVVPPYYDSLIAKVICRANDREDARARLERALDEMYVLGIDTNLEMHRKLINDPNFINGTFNINYLENLNKEK